ncbi:MAG: flippase-like domain-containing protein [Acidobacteriota bacterium]|nr:flippase-like domain-containing protein [Acidobacteriota bacterium]
MIAFSVFVLVALAFLYVVLPQLGGVRHTWDRLNDGDLWWIGVALVFELISMASYVALFQGIHVPPGSSIRLVDSYKITMASLAATRLFAAGGAGGVVLTAWSLRRSGMARGEVAMRMMAFLVLLYGVYVVAMILCGVGLYTGLLAGPRPFAITIGPAIFGAVAIALFLAAATVPEHAWLRLRSLAAGSLASGAPPLTGHGRRADALRASIGRLVGVPASLVAGIRFAIAKVRHPDLALLGAVSWWALNIGVLYASFRAFGVSPPLAVVVQAYFVGMLANLLPLPGGIGAVEGGMIGASVALGIEGGGALIAVLMYRLFAFWLPSIPGGVAYFQLRRTVSRWRMAADAPA